MINRVGLNSQPLRNNYQPIRNQSKQALGFGNHDYDEMERLSTADRFHRVADGIEEKVVKPVLELATIGYVTKFAAGRIGNKINTVIAKPMESNIAGLSKFLAEETQNTGIVGDALRKFKPLANVVEEKGAGAAEHLTGILTKSSNIGVKCLAGILGAVVAAKEMPRLEQLTSDIRSDLVRDLGTTALISDLAS